MYIGIKEKYILLLFDFQRFSTVFIDNFCFISKEKFNYLPGGSLSEIVRDIERYREIDR